MRQQLQNVSSKTVPKARPTFWGTTMMAMIRENPLSLWKGLSASWLREASYSGIRFGAYDLCKAGVLQTMPFLGKDSFGTKLLAGMASGMIGAGIANPADVVSQVDRFAHISRHSRDQRFFDSTLALEIDVDFRSLPLSLSRSSSHLVGWILRSSRFDFRHTGRSDLFGRMRVLSTPPAVFQDSTALFHRRCCVPVFSPQLN